MGKYLRYIVLSGEAPPGISFRLHTLAEMFELELGKCRSDGVVKLILELTTQPGEHAQVDGPLIDVVTIKHYYDPNSVPKSDFEQKQFLLNCLCDCIDTFVARFGWDGGHCRRTAERLKDAKFVVERKWKKPAVHPTTKRRAQARIRIENEVRLLVEVTDLPRSASRQRFLYAFRGMGELGAGFGRLEWIGEDDIRVWQSNERDFWNWSLADDRVTFHYPRAERNDPHGLCDLAKCYLYGRFVAPDRARATELLKQSAARGFARAQQLLDRMERGEE